MVKPTLPIGPSPAITVSDVRALRQLADSGQLKSWQAGAVMDVVVNRREGALLMVDTGKGVVGLPVPAESGFKPGTALQLQVLTLAPLQLQLRPAPTPIALGSQATVVGTLAGSLGAAAELPVPSGTAPVTAFTPLPHAARPTSSDPVATLAAQLKAVLQPIAGQTEPQKLAPLPQRLSEWLARLPPTLTLADDASLPHPQTATPAAVDWPKLAGSLLASWPSPQQASEPESLEHLLKQALFGEPARSTTSTANATTPNAPADDWLGTVLRLLISLPATTTQGNAPLATPLPTAPANAAAQNPPVIATDSEMEDVSKLLSQPLPLPDDLVDQLASLLGRSQQHWLGNLQADIRQQPLYGELLLRHGERLDPFELSVREDGSRNEHEGTERAVHHVVRLRFDLPGLGVCQFLLDLHADDLQLHFYSEQAETVALFNTHLDTLAATLAADAIHLNLVQSHRVEQLPALQLPPAQGFHVRA